MKRGSSAQGLGITWFAALIATAMLPALVSCAGKTPRPDSEEEAPKKQLSKTEKARLLIESANGSLLDNDPTTALIDLANAEQYDSKLPELYHSRALAYYQKRDLNNAKVSVERALSLMPQYANANITYGRILMDLGQYHEAQKPLEVAAQDPLNREAYKALTNLGIIHYKMGNFSRANESFERATNSAPTLACLAYYYLGHIAVREGRLTDAIRNYDSGSRKLCSRFMDSHMALGVAFERNGDYDRARKKFLEIKKGFPNSPVAEQAMERLKHLP